MDPYETLRIRRDATPAEVQRAYRRLAKRYHPDLNSGDPAAEERFKRILEAYQTLTGRKSPKKTPMEVPVASYTEHPFFRFFHQMRGGSRWPSKDK